jgi:ketosteroid isomerase-like protein
MRLFCFLVLLFLATSAAAADAGGPRAGPPPTKALTDEIAALDRALFEAVFDKCDTKVIAAFVTEDFEMYHDKNGLSAKSGAQFVQSIDAMCTAQKSGVDYRARRELVPGSLKVYPLANYGAIETGEHRFYQVGRDNSEKLVETAQFTHVWKRQGTGWKLSRVLSYDHKLVP